MITDSDIIRILSDERLDRKILATIRRALRAPDEPEHVSESDKPLPTTWGMIPIRTAAQKYGRTMEDIAEAIAEAIAERKCKGNDTHVDEESYRLWHYDGRKRGLPPMEVTAPVMTEDDANDMRAFRNAVPSLPIAEAAERLGLSEENITDHILAGSMKGVGDDRVAESSVLKYEDVLRAAGAGGLKSAGAGAGGKNAPAPAPAPASDDTMTTSEAAKFLGINKPTVYTYVHKGLLTKSGWGKVTRASVVAYKERQNASASAHTPPPIHATTRTGGQADAHVPVAHGVDAGPSMTVVEAAAYLGRSTQHVHVDAAQGRLVRAGRGLLTRASVEALYAKRVRKGLLKPEPAEA